MSEKTGDNAQLLALAKALPWPSAIKRVAVREPYVLGKPKVAASLHHVDPSRSDALEPPWPDLVITVGRRMSMVALWIKDQSGGRARLVLIGAPKGFPGRFDLIVVSGQYRLARRSNVVRVAYPLQYVDEQGIAAEVEVFREKFGRLPYPLIAVMVGGRTKAVRFDADVAVRLAHEIAELARRERGTLFVTTSRRTPPAVVEALQRELPKDAILHQWTPDASWNPYRALLGSADRFVVTSDSLSMLMEIARLGRPLAIYSLPASSWLIPPASSLEAEEGATKARVSPIVSFLGKLALFLSARGPRRDLTAISKRLVRDGLAVWFGERFRLDARRPPDELAQIAARVVALMEAHPAGSRAVPSVPGLDHNNHTVAAR